MLFTAIMLMGVVHNINAQNELDYSLEGISRTLNRLYIENIGDFNEGLAWIRVKTDDKNYRYGYIDKKGRLVIPCIYDNVKDFSEGLARVSEKDWKFGFIDKKGNTIIPFTLGEHTGSFSEGLASVRPDEDYTGYINKKGEFVIPVMKRAGIGGAFGGGIAPIRIDNNETFFIDIHGNEVIPSRPIRSFGYKDGFYVVREKNRRFGVIDVKGNFIFQNYNGINGFSEGLFVVNKMFEKKDESGYSRKFLYGFVDTQGRETISPQYDKAQSFSDGLAAVEKDKKWGYINKQGQFVIPVQYEEAYDFHEGLAFVKTKEHYIVIDKQGKVVSLHPNYSYFRGHFSEGLNAVMLNGQWGYVDIYGNSTFNPKMNHKPKAINQDNKAMNDASTIIPSSFPGGDTAMRRFIATTKKYPVQAEEEGEQGVVIVGFTVEEDGSLTNIHVNKSVSMWLDKEAMRVVSRMPKWQPAQSGGLNVKSEQTVKIGFILR